MLLPIAFPVFVAYSRSLAATQLHQCLDENRQTKDYLDFTMIEPEELIERLKRALSQFIAKEIELIRQDAHEEAISCAFIPYLREEFKDWPFHIDSQYNKRIVNDELIKKQVKFLLRHLPKSKIPQNVPHDSETVVKSILADVIFHDRESPSHNLLVIEIKKSTNTNRDDRDYDQLKLRVITKYELKYSFGAFVEFSTGKYHDQEKPFSLEVIANGERYYP